MPDIPATSSLYNVMGDDEIQALVEDELEDYNRQTKFETFTQDEISTLEGLVMNYREHMFETHNYTVALINQGKYLIANAIAREGGVCLSILSNGFEAFANKFIDPSYNRPRPQYNFQGIFNSAYASLCIDIGREPIDDF